MFTILHPNTRKTVTNSIKRNISNGDMNSFLIGFGIALPNILHSTISSKSKGHQYLHVIDRFSDGFIYFNRCNIESIKNVDDHIIGPLREEDKYINNFKDQFKKYSIDETYDINKIIKLLNDVSINPKMLYDDLLEYRNILHNIQEPFLPNTNVISSVRKSHWNTWASNYIQRNLTVKDMIGLYAVKLR